MQMGDLEVTTERLAAMGHPVMLTEPEVIVALRTLMNVVMAKIAARVEIEMADHYQETMVQNLRLACDAGDLTER
jgi:hypothetical protein